MLDNLIGLQNGFLNYMAISIDYRYLIIDEYYNTCLHGLHMKVDLKNNQTLTKYTRIYGVMNGLCFEFLNEEYICVYTDYLNGAKHGQQLKYKRHTLIESTEFINDKLDGLKVIYRNGNVIYAIEYKNNQKHGLKRRYDASGILLEEGMYEYDRLHGALRVFNSKGLSHMSEYVHGGLIQSWNYYESGKIESYFTNDTTTYYRPDGTIKRAELTDYDRICDNVYYYDCRGKLVKNRSKYVELYTISRIKTVWYDSSGEITHIQIQ